MRSYLEEKAMKAENNFNRALREAVSSELSDAILHEAKNPHTFSDDFLRKMDKLTKAEQSRFWRMTSTVPKRIAVIMRTTFSLKADVCLCARCLKSVSEINLLMMETICLQT